MKVQQQAMGMYQTNCYIVTIDNKDIIIDPGVDATEWVLSHVKNPIAILNTHGHFDHVWSNAELKKKLNIPLYAPKGDVFMLEKSTFLPDLPPSHADVEISGEKVEIEIEGIKILFRHYPGHCPGCSTIEIGDSMFSGDFIFERSIGRSDFPYSNAEDMKASLEKFMLIDYDRTVYPGHGGSTTIKAEQKNTPYWISQF